MDKYNHDYDCKELTTFDNETSAKEIIIRLIKDRCDKDLYRGISSIKNLNRKSYNQNHELNIIKKYIHLYNTVLNDRDLKIFAQHYDVNTNYLDFTYNPLIALFFAVSNLKNENEEYEVIRISKEDYNEKILRNSAAISDNKNSNKAYSDNKYGFLKGPSQQQYISKSNGEPELHNKFNEKSNDDDIGGNYNLQLKEVLNIGPSGCASFQYDYEIKTIEKNGKLNIHVPDVYTNQHIFNQQGVFCILEDDFSEKYGETVIKSILKVSHVYRIPKKLRNGILMELEALGIDEIHLFQDIKGLVDHAKIKLSWVNSNDKT